MRILSPNLVATLAITLLATACGGGGGGSSTNSVPAPDPAPAPEPAPEPIPPEAFNISGAITASDSQAVDGDTNDPFKEVISNDTVTSGQPSPYPTPSRWAVTSTSRVPARQAARKRAAISMIFSG